MTRDLAAEWLDLLASGRARWCPGMAHLDPDGRRWRRVRGGWEHEGSDHGWCYGEPPWPMVLDGDDPATLGCLLGLVREAWGDAGASSVYQPAWDTEPARWCVAGLMHGGWRGEFADTEAAALLSALAAAPVRT